MDLFQLETFLVVCREKTFSQAASKLHRTQPAVSQTIKRLEDELGERLFDRSSRDGTLTCAGRILENYATRLVMLREQARKAIVAMQQLQTGGLTMAANELTSLYLVRVLKEFRHFCSGISIVVQRYLANHIPEAVLDHKVDLGVVSFMPEQSSISSIVVYLDELMLVTAPNHPLAFCREVALEQLGAESFVAHNVSSPTRERVANEFRRRNVPLHIVVELPTLEAIKKFVMMGNSVTLIPSSSVEEEVAKNELTRIPVKGLSFERKLRIVYRKGGELSPAAQAFLRITESLAKSKKGRYIYQVER
jgi:DNA-binding transcriptional LysR family regulator